jgi:hypothetical protein
MDEEEEEVPPVPDFFSVTREHIIGDGAVTNNDAPKINGTLDSHKAS